jgi:hypothetical protein
MLVDFHIRCRFGGGGLLSRFLVLHWIFPCWNWRMVVSSMIFFYNKQTCEDTTIDPLCP